MIFRCASRTPVHSYDCASLSQKFGCPLMSTQAFNHYDKSSQAFMAVIDQMVVLLWSFSTALWLKVLAFQKNVTSA